MAVRNYYFVHFQIDPKDIDGVASGADIPSAQDALVYDELNQRGWDTENKSLKASISVNIFRENKSDSKITLKKSRGLLVKGSTDVKYASQYRAV